MHTFVIGCKIRSGRGSRTYRQSEGLLNVVQDIDKQNVAEYLNIREKIMFVFNALLALFETQKNIPKTYPWSCSNL